MAIKTVPQVTNGAADNHTAVQLLQDQIDTLYSAVEQAMRQNILDNSGKLGSVRYLPKASHQIVDVFLQFLADNLSMEQMDRQLKEMVDSGLGAKSAIAIADTLYDNCFEILNHSGDFSAWRSTIQRYRQRFVHQYIQAHTTYLTATREQVYHTLNTALEKQIRLEHQSLEESQRSQALLRAILDNLPVGVFVAEFPSGKPLLVNAAGLDLLGRGIDPEQGANEYTEVYQTYKPEQDEPFPTQELPLVRTLTDGQIYRGEVDIVRPNGRITVDVVSAPVLNTEGQMISATAIFQDVTNRRKMEAALRMAQTNTQAILDSITVPLVISSIKSGLILYANQPLADITGISLDLMIGRQTPDFYANLTERQTFLSDLSASGSVSNYELTLKRDNGEPFSGLISARFFNYENEPSILVTFIDITERKQAEAVLTASQIQLAEALRIAKLANWEYDILADKFTFNDQFYALLRTTAEEQGGYTMSSGQYSEQFVHPDDAPLVGVEIEKALMTTDPNYSAQLDHRIIYGDGEIGYVTVRFRIQKDAEGRTIKTFGANQDITERKRSETILLASQAQLAEALRIAKLANWEYDVLTDTFTFNDQFYTLLRTTVEQQGGYTMSSGRYSEQFVYPEDAPLVGEEIGKAITTTDPNYMGQVEHRIIYGNGEIGYVAVNFRIQKDVEGRTVRTFGANQDITERKRAEILREKQARELEAVAQISTAVATTLDTQKLLQDVVDLTKSRFDLYHAHIYLLNESGDTLVLTAGAGEVGKQMATEGRQIPLNQEQSLVARAVRTRQGVIVNDVQGEPGFLPNTLLPQTRSELASPMIMGDVVLGVLDVQSDKENHFTEEDINIQTTLAAQVAIALQNARSFERSEKALQEMNMLTRRLTREGWDTYLTQGLSTPMIDYVYGSEEVSSTVIADEDGETAVSHLISPLTIQGETIGQLILDEPHTLVDEAVDILGAVAERLSTHIESLRLNEQTQQALAQTEILYKGIDRIVRATTLDEVLHSLLQSNTSFQRLDRANIMFFNRPWQTDLPELATVATIWEKGNKPSPAPVGTIYQLSQLPFTRLLDRTTPTVVQNAATDDKVDENTRALLLNRLKMQSIIFVPLTVSGECIGFFTGQAEKPLKLSDEEIRQINSLTDQAATVIQNQRLFEQTQAALAQTEAQARSLSVINQIAQTVAQQIDPILLLESVYEQVRQLMPADAFIVGLYNASAHMMEFPIVYDDGQRYEQAPSPPSPASNFYKVVLSGESVMINRTPEEVEERQKRAAQNTLGNTAKISASLVYVPLTIGQQTLGAMSVQSYHFNSYEQSDVAMLNGIANHVAVALENARLFEQTQVALAETGALYQTSTQLNSAASLEEALQAAIEPARATGASGSILLKFDLDENGQPAWTQLIAYTGEEQILPIGARFELKSFPFGELMLSDPGNTLLISDVEKDERLDVTSRNLLLQLGAKAAVIMGLLVGSRWVGQIVITWKQPYHFTPTEQRLYNTISAQAAALVDNFLLFEQERQRATQLQLLAQVEVSLSLADSEDKILQPIVEAIVAPDLTFASLIHVNSDAAGKPISFDLVSLWSNGVFLPEVLDGFKNVPLESYPLSRLWLYATENLIVIEDVQQDPRMDELIMQTAEQQAWRSLAMLPLRITGRWQGLIALNWTNPHKLSESERFLLEGILEPVSAIVTTRRAQLAQQLALQETEILYKAAAELNVAQKYEQVLETLRQYTVLGEDSNNISLNYFDKPWTSAQTPEWIDVLGRWSVLPPENVMPRYHLSTFPSANKLLQIDGPTVIEDVATDVRLDENVRALYMKRLLAQSTIFVPLVVGGQWLGYINAVYPQHTTFQETELRRLAVIGGQAAVAIQTIRLLEETNRLFAQEQLRTQELTVLNQMARDLTIALDEETVAEKLYEYTSLLMDTRNFYMAVYDPVTDEVKFPIFVDDSKRRSVSPRKPQGLTGAILEYGSPVLVEDGVDKWLTSIGKSPIGCDSYSMLGVPLKSGNQVLGIINLQSSQPHVFNTNHLNLLTAVVSQGTIALQNAQLFQQTQQRARREQILREIATKVRSSSDVDTVMRTAVQEIGRALGRRSFVYLDNPLEKES